MSINYKELCNNPEFIREVQQEIGEKKAIDIAYIKTRNNFGFNEVLFWVMPTGVWYSADAKDLENQYN